MKNKNLWLTIFLVWFIISLANTALCIINILFNNQIGAIFTLALAVGCWFFTGKMHEVYKAAKKFDEYMNQKFDEFVELLKKPAKPLEPFEEFQIKNKENEND